MPAGWEIIEPKPYIILKPGDKEYKVTKPFIRRPTTTSPDERKENFNRAKQVFKESSRNSLIYFTESYKGEDIHYLLLTSNFLKENKSGIISYELLRNIDLEGIQSDKETQFELLLNRGLAAGSNGIFSEASSDFSIAEGIFPENAIYKRRFKEAYRIVARREFHVSRTREIERHFKYQNVFSPLTKCGGLFINHNGSYLVVQYGGAYYINESINLILSGGPGFNISGHEKRFIILTDLLVNYNVDRFYFGGGLGFHSKVKDDLNYGAEMVLNVGYYVLSKVSLFAEMRTSLGKGYPVFSRNMFLLGIRGGG